MQQLVVELLLHAVGVVTQHAVLVIAIIAVVPVAIFCNFGVLTIVEHTDVVELVHCVLFHKCNFVPACA